MKNTAPKRPGELMSCLGVPTGPPSTRSREGRQFEPFI